MTTSRTVSSTYTIDGDSHRRSTPHFPPTYPRLSSKPKLGATVHVGDSTIIGATCQSRHCRFPVAKAPVRFEHAPSRTRRVARPASVGSRWATRSRSQGGHMEAKATARNVALVGSSGSGKTTLLESMLFAAGAIGRKGSV